jgi:hypothetical protein
VSDAPVTTPRRGRPRSEKARQAILQAAAELLLDHGMARSKERLALDALLEWAAAGSPPRDTGTLRGDVLALVRPWVREIRRRPFGRVIAGLITEAQSNPEFALEYRRHFVEQRRGPMRLAFARAVERGEARADLDVDVALDLIYGPLYHRLLHGHAPLTDRFAQAVVDLALDGILRRGGS